MGETVAVSSRGPIALSATLRKRLDLKAGGVLTLGGWWQRDRPQARRRRALP